MTDNKETGRLHYLVSLCDFGHITYCPSLSVLACKCGGRGGSISVSGILHSLVLHLDSVKSELETFVEKKPDYCTETLRAFILAIDS